MTRRQIESRFYGIPYLPAPEGGSPFCVSVNSTICTSQTGVAWKAEIAFADDHAVQQVSRRVNKKRHLAMLAALRDFDRSNL